MTLRSDTSQTPDTPETPNDPAVAAVDAADPGTSSATATGVSAAESLRSVPAAVLWDMDGTLVDTEPYWIEEEYALIAEYGGSWSDADAKSLVGNDLITSANYIRDVGGVTLSVEKIIDRLLDRVIARVQQHIPWRPGARELLAELNARSVPCALVTMSYQSLAQAVLASLPPGSFVTVVAGDDVTHGKPHPEAYLTAAARLGVAPEDCVAIEDSLTGVRSAVAARVPVLAVEHLVTLPPGPGRTVVTSLVGWHPEDLAALSARA